MCARQVDYYILIIAVQAKKINVTHFLDWESQVEQYNVAHLLNKKTLFFCRYIILYGGAGPEEEDTNLSIVQNCRIS